MPTILDARTNPRMILAIKWGLVSESMKMEEAVRGNSQ